MIRNEVDGIGRKDWSRRGRAGKGYRNMRMIGKWRMIVKRVKIRKRKYDWKICE